MRGVLHEVCQAFDGRYCSQGTVNLEHLDEPSAAGSIVDDVEKLAAQYAKEFDRSCCEIERASSLSLSHYP